MGTRRGGRQFFDDLARNLHRIDVRGHVSLNLGILLAFACAIATQLGFLYKHKGANEAPTVDIRHPLRSARQLYSCKWFAIGMAVATGGWFFHVAALAFARLLGVPAGVSPRGLVVAGVPRAGFG